MKVMFRVSIRCECPPGWIYDLEKQACVKVKRISIRIRRAYFDEIVSGDKDVEYRKFSEFWRKRLSSLGKKMAVFICGKQVHRRWITRVEHVKTPSWFSEQGKRDVSTDTCFKIYLGEKVEA